MSEVQLTIDEHVAVVTLDRPHKRNAITLAMQGELIAAIERVAHARSVRVLVLTGAGSDFCVGGDRSVVERISAESGFAGEAAAQHRRLFTLLLNLDIPVIAAIEGGAFGFGAELAAASDVVVVGKGARLADPHVRFGLPPAPMLLLVWPQLTSRAVAAELVLTGREVEAAEAVALGLAGRVVPTGTALDAAFALAATIAALPLEGVRLAKRALRIRVDELDRHYPQEPQAPLS